MLNRWAERKSHALDFPVTQAVSVASAFVVVDTFGNLDVERGCVMGPSPQWAPGSKLAENPRHREELQ